MGAEAAFFDLDKTVISKASMVAFGRPPGDRLAMLRRREPRSDLVGLAGAQSRAADLRDLVLQEVQASRQFARIDREFGQTRSVRSPALDDVGHGRARGPMPSECIKQVALPALIEQPLLIVLPVDLDERPDLIGEP